MTKAKCDATIHLYEETLACTLTADHVDQPGGGFESSPHQAERVDELTDQPIKWATQ